MELMRDDLYNLKQETPPGNKNLPPCVNPRGLALYRVVVALCGSLRVIAGGYD